MSTPGLKHRDASRRCLWRTRGIKMTTARYDEMLAEQGGVCKICRRPPKRRRLAVDHVHGTDVIRGLLCSPCNVVLGHLEKRLAAFVEYLHPGASLRKTHY